jgi:hypothetical protein
MKWQQVRENFPSQWLLVEAIKAHTEGNQRIVEDLAVVDSFPDSRSAWKCYVNFHELTPEREFYVVHTDRKMLDILQRRWAGIRGLDFLLDTGAVIDLMHLVIHQGRSP